MANHPEEDGDEPENRPEGEPAEKATRWQKHLAKFEREDRDDYGRFRKGHSGNPGGIPRAAVEARRAFMHHLPRAIQRTAALMEYDDPIAVSIATGRVFARALGKESAPSELPDDTPLPPAAECSPALLLGRALSLIERNIARAESQMKDGQPISETERASLREDIGTLSSLLKAEQDSAKAKQPGAELSDSELKAKVLQAMTAEELATALSQRKGIP